MARIAQLELLEARGGVALPAEEESERGGSSSGAPGPAADSQPQRQLRASASPLARGFFGARPAASAADSPSKSVGKKVGPARRAPRAARRCSCVRVRNAVGRCASAPRRRTACSWANPSRTGTSSWAPRGTAAAAAAAAAGAAGGGRRGLLPRSPH
eukprot:scaffold731_cov328-Prasinococcus_capsulatus_cf.AAC.10